jgi:DNA (cytosine-5)-methyltransferase 1
MLPLLDLFSGIGGFSLGLERSGGFKTVAFAECEPFCQKVLAKHWPGVPIYDDVREITAARLAADGITGVRAICGGFPCQDISSAGKGAGIDGERSGLWREYARIIGDFRPDYAIVENVRMLLNRGMHRVLGDLAAIGYDAEWHVIPASAVGAPHRRERVWIVAYPQQRESGERSYADLQRGWANEAEQIGLGSSRAPFPDTDGKGEYDGAFNAEMGGTPEPVADAYQPRLQGRLREILRECSGQEPVGSDGSRRFDYQWGVEPDVGRVVDGASFRVDRLKSLGNAVVPQIPEIIGQALMERGA